MRKQACNSGSHVRALTERGCYLVHDPVCRAYPALEIGAHDPLTRGIGQGGTVCQSFGECPSLCGKDIIREHAVDDVPALERRRVVLISRVNDFAGATRASTLG